MEDAARLRSKDDLKHIITARLSINIQRINRLRARPRKEALPISLALILQQIINAIDPLRVPVSKVQLHVLQEQTMQAIVGHAHLFDLGRV